MSSRDKFEAWMTAEQWFHDSDFEWDERRNCYSQFGIHLAYKAWQAATKQSEDKCAALAAEVQAVRWACGQVYMKGYNHGHLNTVDGLDYASDTELVERGGEVLADFTDPDHCGVAADAILAEVRASALEYYANLFKDTVNMDVKHNQEFHKGTLYVADQFRKGAAQ